MENPELAQVIGAEIVAGAEIETLEYKLLHGDLREFRGIEEKLRRLTLKEGPTLVIAECVFSYIEGNLVDELISSISQLFDHVGFIIYDIIGPNDAFGKVMTQNLAARGIVLKGTQSYPTVNSQIQRFQRYFQQVQGFDMQQIYDSCLNVDEKHR